METQRFIACRCINPSFIIRLPVPSVHRPEYPYTWRVGMRNSLER
jgi:hypothetical protein